MRGDCCAEGRRYDVRIQRDLLRVCLVSFQNEVRICLITGCAFGSDVNDCACDSVHGASYRKNILEKNRLAIAFEIIRTYIWRNKQKMKDPYFSDHSRISKSGLDLINKSPAHYKAYIDGYNDEEPTPAMAFGSLVHCMLLEPGLVSQNYHVLQFDGRTAAGKAEREEASGKTLISLKDWDKAEAIANQVRLHPTWRKLAPYDWHTEHVIEWDANGIVPARSKLDIIVPELSIICDVKTTADASPEAFAKSVANYRYHVQAAFYLDACKQAFNQDFSFMFCVVEKESPFNVAFYDLDEEAIYAGRLEYLADLQTYSDCLEADEWPGYSKKIERISLPAWYWKK